MTHIIGFSGKKQSGKGTSANMLHGMMLKAIGGVKDFKISEEGQLIIQTSNANGVVDWGILDPTRRDGGFLTYAEDNLFPYIKMYSFADTLKWACVDLFEIDHRKIYGTDEQKNELTQYQWKDMPGLRKEGCMTGREFMQHFGTNVMRKIFHNVWVNNTIKRIEGEGSKFAVIADVRFPGEVDAILSAGGEVVRLTRDPYQDSHESETALDPENFDFNKFTHVIDNSNSDIQDLCSSLNRIYSRVIT